MGLLFRLLKKESVGLFVLGAMFFLLTNFDYLTGNFGQNFFHRKNIVVLSSFVKKTFSYFFVTIWGFKDCHFSGKKRAIYFLSITLKRRINPC